MTVRSIASSWQRLAGELAKCGQRHRSPREVCRPRAIASSLGEMARVARIGVPRGRTSKEAIAELREAFRHTPARPRTCIRLSSSQILLFSVLLDSQGPSSCESMAAEVRQNVIRSGDTFLFGCLHARFAEFEAKRGNSARAFRHLEAGFRLLATKPNALASWCLVDCPILHRSSRGGDFTGSTECSTRSRCSENLWPRTTTLSAPRQYRALKPVVVRP